MEIRSQRFSDPDQFQRRGIRVSAVGHIALPSVPLSGESYCLGYLAGRAPIGSCSILAVSNVWNEEKGLKDVLELRRILPSDYAITVVGLSPDQIHGLPTGVTGLGRLSADSLVSLYNAADVFVNTTYADTFPTVNLEALACGTPVVTYATGGSPEAVDEKTGIVVPCGDVQAMADAIVRLKEVPLSRSDCRHRAIECFDKDKCFDKYIDLYESLIGHTILPSGEFQEQ